MTERASTGDAGRLDERRRSINERIAVAAIELFDADGYSNVTVEQIADQAGVALRSFYRYYSSKADVLGPIADASVHRILDRIERTPVGSGLREHLRTAVLDETEGGGARGSRRVAAAMLQVPELLPRWLVANRTLERGLSELLPRSYDVEPGLSSQTAAAVATACVATAVERAVIEGDALGPTLRATLTYIPDLRRI